MENINHIQNLNNKTMLHHRLRQYGSNMGVLDGASALLTYCLPAISSNGTSQMWRNQRNLVSAIFPSVNKTRGYCYFRALLSINSPAIPTVGTYPDFN